MHLSCAVMLWLLIMLALAISMVKSFDRIGIVRVTPSTLLPIPSGSYVTKKAGDPFEIYCGRDVNYNQCQWNWPSDACRYIQLVNGSDFNFCPFEVRTDLQGNCFARLDAFDAIQHQGIWQCGLSSDQIDDMSKMNISILDHTPALIEVNPKSTQISKNASLDITCRTTNKVFQEHSNDDLLLHWTFNPSNGAAVLGHTQNHTVRNCDDEDKCEVISYLHLVNTAESIEVSCHAEQKDSFGATIIGSEKTVIVEVIIDEQGGGLSKGAKIGIALGVLVPFLIILICIILAFFLGWCRFFGGDTDKKGPSRLEVRDAPLANETPPYYLQPVIYDQVHKGPPISFDKPKMSYQAALDELLIYKWEGRGPYSSGGSGSSLSSLSSFGHVDDLVLSKELLKLGTSHISTSSSPSVGSLSSTGSMSLSQDHHHLFKDSWV